MGRRYSSQSIASSSRAGKECKAGVKILMSGGSRCNITHNCDIEGIIQALAAKAVF